MPNYCENFLTVMGNTSSDIDRFWMENRISEEEAEKYDYDSGQDLSFMKSVPVDITKDRCDECVEMWGTKWDACDPSGSKGQSTIDYHFNTAWSPPSAWLEKVAKKYPELIFEMESKEPGFDFYIRVCYENGVETERKESTYEEYMDDEYQITEKANVILQLIRNNPEMLEKCEKLYLEDSDIQSFEEYLDQYEYVEEDEDDVIRKIIDIMDDYDNSEVKYFVCKMIDTEFES